MSLKNITELKIEKGIPIPDSDNNLVVTATLKKMEVGDSFFVEGAKHSQLSSRISQLKKQEAFKLWNFITRKETKEIEYGQTKIEGVRVWRAPDTVIPQKNTPQD